MLSRREDCQWITVWSPHTKLLWLQKTWNESWEDTLKGLYSWSLYGVFWSFWIVMIFFGSTILLMFDMKARRACDHVNSPPPKDMCFHLLFSSHISYDPWDRQSSKIGGEGTSFKIILVLIWKCICQKLNIPFHHFTSLQTSTQSQMFVSITLNGTCLHPFSLARLFNWIPWELEITKAEVSLLSLHWWTIIADSFSYVAAFLCWFHWHCVSLFELRECSCCLSVGVFRSR